METVATPKEAIRLLSRARALMEKCDLNDDLVRMHKARAAAACEREARFFTTPR